MTPPVLDPYPLGCPIGIALTPAEMQQAVALICQKLLDIACTSVHVVTPSRGDAYPMLNLLSHRGASKPRLVLFPGWEDARRRRRITWKRQDTLMRRIRAARVEAEPMEVAENDGNEGGPFVCSLACTAAEMDALIHDIDAYVGDLARITVTKFPWEGENLRVVRIYAPNGEPTPRLVFFPGWFGDEETPAGWIGDRRRMRMYKQLHRADEQPVELYLRR